MLRGAALLERLLAQPMVDRDAWINELLGFGEPPPDLPLPRGAVPYLPSGVEEILAMLREVPVRPDDVLVDLGSGEGRVVVLAHLLTGAHTCGVELQGPLVQSARARAAALNLPACTFHHGNAAEGVPEGSIYYLYAPFNGEMLTRTLHHLEALAQKRPLVICTVDLELRPHDWLIPRPPVTPALTLYDSHKPGVPRRAR